MTEVSVQSVQSVQTGSIQNPRITWEGCSVLLDINDGDRLVFARLSAGSNVKIGNVKCSLQPLIGCPFGSLFQVESGSKGPYLSRVIAPAEGDLQEKGDCLLKDESRDNRSLVDDNKAQSLSGEDIEALRRDGATGDQIVEALIANSSTFEKKTLFSQEKYRLKKQKKYAPRVLVRRPFARRIECIHGLDERRLNGNCGTCNTEDKFTEGVGEIVLWRRTGVEALLARITDVELILFFINNTICLTGSGYVCNTYFGGVPYPMDITRMFNFNNEISSRIVQTSLSDLSSAEGKNSEQGAENHLCSAEDKNSEQGAGNDLCSAEAKNSIQGVENGRKEVTNLWRQNGFSSLIVAALELDTWSAVQELLPLLSYSAPFAIYHQYLQPLATCMHNLQNSKLAIGLQISEPWLREYQVLPSRTHPSMQMSAFGGYILSGTRICTGESVQQTS
ncbi:tRNA (adenine(58)-N(1))-methyltransferase non-catalytic subunit trm6 [Macadamia integrifolia]|uniref:tRNA (adenine(58)-N(1))-methyltransferase non-catalytic subunit trm6 n=1 Tax=Macadamia integrifolia TaxID=60698 RepID=UPI001C4E6058|nr:tRNA (adenine(58)-N(1))-methyltransferase non-catalytic subunit trm6 [Macadamia integrifolia]